MQKITGKTFTNQEITLDGHIYEGCNFESCTLVFSACAPFGLTGNHVFGDTKFVFAGAAADTVAAMKAIYSMGEWGRRNIAATFEQIAPDIKNLH